MGLKEYIEAQENPESYQGLFLETAHPIKFLDAIKKVLKTDIETPYSFSWDTTINIGVHGNEHALSAIVVDMAGNTTFSQPILVTVDN